MDTKNNLVSIEHSVVLRIEDAIIDALSNRAGKWVGEHILYAAAEQHIFPNMRTSVIIEQMITNRIIEKRFITISDKLQRSYQVPTYRLSRVFK